MGPTGGLPQALLVTCWHQGRKAEARGLVPQIQDLMPGMSARWEVSEMAFVAPGPRRIVLAAFLAAGLPE